MVARNPNRGFLTGIMQPALRGISRLTQFAIGSSGYDATKEKNRRAAPTGMLRSEDAELPATERRKLISAGRDIHRNFSLAAWMLRKHLDYVSSFTFQCRSGNPQLDNSVERLVRWWSSPANCDITGRFSLAKIVRLAEMRRTVDGDVFLLKLNDGRLQPIEGDRVRTPTGSLPDNFNANDLLHGVQTNPAGRPIKYCVCKRGRVSDAGTSGYSFEFERLVSATNMFQFGYFDRFDQVRGISPMAAGLNTLRDTYEGFDYALAKMKVSQMFGLVFYREKSDDLGVTTTSEDDGSGYEVDLGRGPIKLDLDPGDRAEFLESRSPSTEFQAFSQTMIGVALKSLDIPYSFYAENFTNYSGARQAMLQYELSAKIKRADVQALLDHLTAWRLSLWIQDGVLDAQLGDIRWNWIPNGIGWIDPLKEVDANIAAINAGLDTRTRILREQGIDFFELADELAAESQYLADKQLPAVSGAENRQPMLEVVGAN